jgi:hypothetical protein
MAKKEAMCFKETLLIKSGNESKNRLYLFSAEEIRHR